MPTNFYGAGDLWWISLILKICVGHNSGCHFWWGFDLGTWQSYHKRFTTSWPGIINTQCRRDGWWSVWELGGELSIHNPKKLRLNYVCVILVVFCLTLNLCCPPSLCDLSSSTRNYEKDISRIFRIIRKSNSINYCLYPYKFVHQYGHFIRTHCGTLFYSGKRGPYKGTQCVIHFMGRTQSWKPKHIS